MKKVALILSTTLLATSAFAQGPRFFCKSDDGQKTIRTAPGPWKLLARVYHDEVLYQVLKCEQNTADYLLFCTDDRNERTFRVNYDGRTGLYGGKWDATDLSCEKVGDTAE